MNLRPALAVLLAVTASAPTGAAPDGVRISTVVTDRAGKPVMGLTLKDFELREDGVVQTLVSVEARRPEPRRIAILLDEFHIQAADTARVREAVTSFVSERLRPDDLVLVLKPLDPLPSIRLRPTAAGLRDAIATFEGRKGQPRAAQRARRGNARPRAGARRGGRAQVVLSALRALVGAPGFRAGTLGDPARQRGVRRNSRAG